MTEIQSRIEQLKYTLIEQEYELKLLDTEVRAIRAELDEFEQRYNRLVRPVSERVDAAKSALRQLEELEYRRKRGDDRTVEALWRKSPDTAPQGFSADIPRTAAPDSADELPTADRPANPDDLLKKLYRRLAQKYHPDKASSATVRALYTRLMAQINNAYADNDIEALIALDRSTDDTLNDDIDMLALQLRHLQEKHHTLARQIHDLKGERTRLNSSIMMDLKMKTALARARGRDMLRDLADSLEKDYEACMNRIAELRLRLS